MSSRLVLFLLLTFDSVIFREIPAVNVRELAVPAQGTVIPTS